MANLTCWLMIVTAIGGAPCEQPSAEPYTVSRVSDQIVLDGRIDEDAWQRIEPIRMVGFEPDAGAEPSERTVIRIAYDNQYLYVAAEMRSGDGREPTVNTFTRDRWANDDLLEVLIDSYNDNETAMIFAVNPAGTRIDSQVTNDAVLTFGFPVDPSWNAFWDAAAVRWAGGWSVEMRIPFSSFGFQPRDGVVTMGIIVSRFIARKNETVTFPEIDPRWTLGYNKPSQAQDVIFEGIEPSRPVHVSPYVMAGVQRSTGPDGAASQAAPDREMREIGADVRFAPANNLNVDLSFNTDFAQVESDDHVVNLSRFNLFLPEKRQFFQERAGLFDLRTGGSNRLFYSRRIGIVGSDLARIVAGGRAVGRVGGWDVGTLWMRTAEAPGSPAETFAVGRVRARALNPYSHLGGLVTLRHGDGVHHLTLGVDALLRVDERRYLSVNWGESVDDGSRRPGSSAGSISIEDRNRRGLGYRVTASYAGERFDPKVGFVQRRDFRDLDAQLSWGVFTAPGSLILRWGPLVEGSYLVRGTSGELETARMSLGGMLEFRNGATIRGGAARTHDRLDVPFVLDADAAIPEGRHTFTWGRLFAVSPPASDFGASIFARFGNYYDGTIVSTSVSPRWRSAPYLELLPELEWFSIRRPDRQASFEGSIFRLRGRLSLNTKLSADLLLQHTSGERRSTVGLRVHYFVREGTSLWVALNDDSMLDADRLFRTCQRTLVVKYIHTFARF